MQSERLGVNHRCADPSSGSHGTSARRGISVIFGEYGVAAAGGLFYLGLHFLLYVCVLRDRPFFQSERGIFLYHFCSAAAFSLAALATGVAHFSDAAIAIAIGLIAAHGI